MISVYTFIYTRHSKKELFNSENLKSCACPHKPTVTAKKLIAYQIINSINNNFIHSPSLPLTTPVGPVLRKLYLTPLYRLYRLATWQ